MTKWCCVFLFLSKKWTNKSACGQRILLVNIVQSVIFFIKYLDLNY